MDDVVSSFLQAGTIYLSFACVIVTFFIRRGAEIQWPSLKQLAHENEAAPSYGTKMSEWWNKVILYAISPTVGVLAGTTHINVVHGGLGQMSERMLFGLVVGWLASYLYKIFKKVLSNTTGVELPSGSSPPPPLA